MTQFSLIVRWQEQDKYYSKHSNIGSQILTIIEHYTRNQLKSQSYSFTSGVTFWIISF